MLHLPHLCEDCPTEIESGRFCSPCAKKRNDACKKKYSIRGMRGFWRYKRNELALACGDEAPLEGGEVEVTSSSDTWLTSDAKPRTRRECLELGLRPCPFASCRYNLYIHLNQQGRVTFPQGEDIEQVRHSCALDIAGEGEHSTGPISHVLGTSRQAVDQILLHAVVVLLKRYRSLHLDAA